MFEANQFVYYMFHVFGFIATIIYTLLFYKKYDLKLWRTVAYIVVVFIVSYAFMWFQYWVESGFKEWGNNIVRTFIWVPFIGLLFARLFKIDYHKAIELIAPIPCIIHGVAHFGCISVGCCCGYPWEHGIWNPATHDRRFPNQPIEALVAVAIAIITILRAKEFDYSGKSKAYALMLILFGSTRFVLEFFRDNEKLFWGISSLAIHAFVMFVAGLFFFFFPFDKFKKKKEPAEEEPKQDPQPEPVE